MVLSVTSYRVIAAVLLFCALAACTGGKREATVNDKERSLTTSEIQRLQTEINEGSCKAIYDEAEAGFRRSQPLQEWLDKCEHIRGKWGRWQKFRANSWQRQGPNIIVEGAAGFTKADSVLQLVWTMHEERPRIRWLSLQVENDNIIAPPIPPPLRLDPPVRPKGSPA